MNADIHLPSPLGPFQQHQRALSVTGLMKMLFILAAASTALAGWIVLELMTDAYRSTPLYGFFNPNEHHQPPDLALPPPEHGPAVSAPPG